MTLTPDSHLAEMSRTVGTLLALLAAIMAVRAQVDPSEVRFFLYSRDSIDVSQEMVIGDLQGADFKPWKDIMYIVHSHEQTATDEWFLDMKLYALVARDTQVIGVDWAGPAGGSYANAVSNSKDVGNYMSQFVTFLEGLGGNMTRTHCVGFGIGGHICGHVGMMATGVPFARITGLDPTKDRFNYDDLSDRLDPSDADFVDVIHTCGGNFGFSRVLGHADFFPNDGENCDQPGCGLGFDNKCSHNRAYEYFTESLNTDQFKSYLCESWTQFNRGNCDNNEMHPMGDKCPSTARGMYFLHTWGAPPYARP